MKRLEFLDSLRGLAALYVLMFHLALVPSPALELPRWVEPFVLFGGSGVLLFFVISAFSLCLTMPGHERTGATLFSFYTKRLLRIAPLFYFVLAIAVCRAYWRDVVPSFVDVFGNISFIFNLIPGQQDSLIFAGWTIGVEMLFYGVFPAFHFLFPGLRTKLLAYAGAGLAYYALLLGLEHTLLSTALKDRYALLTVVHYVPVFLMGMIAFDLHTWLRIRDSSRATGSAFLALSLVGFIGCAGGWLNDPPYAPLFWQSVTYAALLLGLAFCPVILLANQAMRFLGQISYSVYLWHGAVIYLMRGIFPHIYATGVPTGAAFLLCLAVTLAVVVPLSWLSYRFIERPGIEWARKLVAARVNSRRLAPQPG